MKTFFYRLKNIGPGAIVAAALVGPGTITTSSVAGAEYGFTLIWTLIFSVIAMIVLQEMATRLGVIGRKDLGTAFREVSRNPIIKTIIIIVIVLALGIGNSAFQSSNIIGGASGLSIITDLPIQMWSFIIGLSAGILLWFGSYKTLERVLVVAVIFMSILFTLTAIVVKPDIGAILSGAFVPSIPDGSIVLVISLIGATITPYTLFLQSSTVQERWSGGKALGQARFDIAFSLVLVGIIAIAILITAAVAFPGTGATVNNPIDMATQLEPLLGSWATIIFSIGIFAAGITSAIGAPLAGAYAISGVLGKDANLKSKHFRIIWIIIAAVGVIFASLGYRPVDLITFAQYINGAFLPIIVLVLITVMNNSKVLGKYVNKKWMNVIGSIIFIVTLILVLDSFNVFG